MQILQGMEQHSDVDTLQLEADFVTKFELITDVSVELY